MLLRSTAAADVDRLRLEQRGQAGEGQRTDECRHERRIDDRSVDRSEAATKVPVVRPPQARHDRIATDAHPGHDVTAATQPAQTPFNALGYPCDRQVAGTRC
jgi:hypothetical protein